MKPVAVAIMAKAPAAGAVKTRLVPPLPAGDAADLYRCFLLDKIAQVRALERAHAVVAYTPAEACGLFETLAPGFELLPQRGPELGARLANGLAELLAHGHGGAMAIDSDTPTLPTAFLQQAVDLLTRGDVDVVIGPCDDGGYYLIGLRTPRPALFENMPWSTPDVLPETLRRARAAGLTTACLPEWFDVDTADDLERLRASLIESRAPLPEHTARFFAEREPKRRSETPWTTISTTPIYANKWLSLREDLVALPDGRTTIYGVVTCGHCVGILPFVDPDTVLLIRQYRYVARRPTWEMPTGGVHDGESLDDAAQRELAEEVGYRAGRLVHACTYHTSKSVVDETAHLYLAEDLITAPRPADDTEFIDVRAFSFAEALAMVRAGEIQDSMTIIAILHAALQRDQRGP